MLLRTLKKKLKQGFHPIEFDGVEIGEGVEKIAYLVDDQWVVKRRTNAVFNSAYKQQAKRVAAQYGAPPVKTHYVNRWMVQPFVPFSNCGYATRETVYGFAKTIKDSDLHEDNCGCDSKGRLFSFDW